MLYYVLKKLSDVYPSKRNGTAHGTPGQREKLSQSEMAKMQPSNHVLREVSSEPAHLLR